MFRLWFTFSAAILLVGSTSLAAQAGQSAIRYRPEQLHCSRFLESSESRILTQSGRHDREQTSGRTGVWQFRATSADGGLMLEGWLDSLIVWRQSEEATIRPDTDGLLGGRYRGRLGLDGAYSSLAQPFIPDEVAEVAGMGTALDDFFPPLPSRPLHPGEAWSGSPGVTIRRLADSALSGVPLYRFHLQVRKESREGDTVRDTVPLELHQVSRETGTFVWHPLLGLLTRERNIVVETTVPAGGPVRQAVRSRIQQQIRVTRDLTSAGPPNCGTPPSN
ncbi:MAG TPA: hypothetical protein VFS51_08345 [Gemmatimonadales bacterium]|nr:hypothetical protein [Gemmatimonadales bacterium]